MDDEGVGRLLRVQLELLGQRHADPLWLEELHDLGSILEIRARRVPEGVPRTPVALLEHGVEPGLVLVAEAELAADSGMPALGERLRELHGQAVELEVVAVLVLLEQ